MYCMKCGTQLEEGRKRCPLCGLPVIHPEIREEPAPRLYPAYEQRTESFSRSGQCLLLTFLTLLPLIVCLLVDQRLNGHVVWSGYVMCALGAFYLCFCLPLWFKAPNSVVFFPIGAAALLGLTLYICLKTGGHWFLSFAFPVGGALLLIIETVIVLMRYTVRGKKNRPLYIFGGAVIALGGLCLLIEFLLKVTFGIPMRWWSLYPLGALFLLGMFFIVTAICRPLQLILHKKLFI